MIENITIGQLLAWGVGITSLIALMTKLLEPVKKLDKRLETIEDSLKDVNTKLANDHERLTRSEDFERLMARSTLALIEHNIDGNHTAQLKAMKEEIRTYFISK